MPWGTPSCLSDARGSLNTGFCAGCPFPAQPPTSHEVLDNTLHHPPRARGKGRRERPAEVPGSLLAS